MNQVDKNLAEILETEYVGSEEDKKIVPKEPITTQLIEHNQVENDANYARTNLYGLIETGNETITDLSKIAKESMHPRAFEVLGQLLKTQSENLDKLLKLQKDKKDLLQTSESSTPAVHVDKAVFVGSTADLLKKIKQDGS